MSWHSGNINLRASACIATVRAVVLTLVTTLPDLVDLTCRTFLLIKMKVSITCLVFVSNTSATLRFTICPGCRSVRRSSINMAKSLSLCRPKVLESCQYLIILASSVRVKARHDCVRCDDTADVAVLVLVSTSISESDVSS